MCDNVRGATQSGTGLQTASSSTDYVPFQKKRDSYKIFAMIIILEGILLFATECLSDTQSGFSKVEATDNISILTQLIDKLLTDAEDETRSTAVINYIDFTTAFDSHINIPSRL